MQKDLPHSTRPSGFSKERLLQFLSPMRRDNHSTSCECSQGSEKAPLHRKPRRSCPFRHQTQPSVAGYVCWTPTWVPRSSLVNRVWFRYPRDSNLDQQKKVEFIVWRTASFTWKLPIEIQSIEIVLPSEKVTEFGQKWSRGCYLINSRAFATNLALLEGTRTSSE